MDPFTVFLCLAVFGVAAMLNRHKWAEQLRRWCKKVRRQPTCRPSREQFEVLVPDDTRRTQEANLEALWNEPTADVQHPKTPPDDKQAA